MTKLFYEWLIFLIGLVHVGDEICEVNGTNVQGCDPKEVVQLLVSKLLLSYTELFFTDIWIFCIKSTKSTISLFMQSFTDYNILSRI